MYSGLFLGVFLWLLGDATYAIYDNVLHVSISCNVELTVARTFLCAVKKSFAGVVALRV